MRPLAGLDTGCRVLVVSRARYQRGGEAFEPVADVVPDGVYALPVPPRDIVDEPLPVPQLGSVAQASAPLWWVAVPVSTPMMEWTPGAARCGHAGRTHIPLE